MPDYTASVTFEAPTFSRAEFRRLAKQLLEMAAEADHVANLTVEPRTRMLTGVMRASAPSSSRAHAKAETQARAMLLRTQYIRRFAVAVHVDLESRHGI